MINNIAGIFLFWVLRPFQDYALMDPVINQVGENWSTRRKTTWPSNAELGVSHVTWVRLEPTAVRDLMTKKKVTSHMHTCIYEFRRTLWQIKKGTNNLISNNVLLFLNLSIFFGDRFKDMATSF